MVVPFARRSRSRSPPGSARRSPVDRGIRASPARGSRLDGPAGTRRVPRTRSVLFAAVTATPPVLYAQSGDVHIAYQVFGEGELDLVLVQGFASHLDIEWENPPSRASSAGWRRSAV